MTKLLYTSLFVLALGCSSPKVDTPQELEPADTIILKSQNNIIDAKQVDSTTDKVIETKVIMAVEKIEVLTKEIIKVKDENAKMKVVLKNPPIIKIVDTVYIEKKRNFWGKEKTNVVIKSDSASIELNDSTTIEIPTQDSTKN